MIVILIIVMMLAILLVSCNSVRKTIDCCGVCWHLSHLLLLATASCCHIINIENVFATQSSTLILLRFIHIYVSCWLCTHSNCTLFFGKILFIEFTCILDEASLTTGYTLLKTLILWCYSLMIIMKPNTSFNINNTIINFILINEITRWMKSVLILVRLIAKLTNAFS